MPAVLASLPISTSLLTLLLTSTLGAASGVETQLRIVTFNAEVLSAPGVRSGQISKYRSNDAKQRHIERVADLIETLSPDILNLVEVTSREAVDLLIKDLHEKGMSDYRGYHVESNDTFSGMDVALISRIKPEVIDGAAIRTIYSKDGDPTWRQSFSFTGYSGSRVTQNTSLARNSIYFFKIAGWRLGFFGLHLKANPSSEYANAKRTAETAIALRAIRSQIAARGYLPVVLGDLNDYDPDVPDHDESRHTATNVLRSFKDYALKRQGLELINVAARIPRRTDRYTSHWDWNENRAVDPQDVRTMIDHILLPKELAPHIKRAFIAHVVSLETSDHFPVVVDLLLPDAE